MSHGSKKSACTDFDYCLLLEASKVITLIVDLLSVVIAVKYLFDISSHKCSPIFKHT